MLCSRDLSSCDFQTLKSPLGDASVWYFCQTGGINSSAVHAELIEIFVIRTHGAGKQFPFSVHLVLHVLDRRGRSEQW